MRINSETGTREKVIEIRIVTEPVWHGSGDGGGYGHSASRGSDSGWGSGGGWGSGYGNSFGRGPGL